VGNRSCGLRSRNCWSVFDRSYLFYRLLIWAPLFLDEYENFASPVSTATSFLMSLASNRTKVTFMPILSFINTVLRSYVQIFSYCLTITSDIRARQERPRPSEIRRSQHDSCIGAAHYASPLDQRQHGTIHVATRLERIYGPRTIPTGHCTLNLTNRYFRLTHFDRLVKSSELLRKMVSRGPIKRYDRILSLVPFWESDFYPSLRTLICISGLSLQLWMIPNCPSGCKLYLLWLRWSLSTIQVCFMIIYPHAPT